VVNDNDAAEVGAALRPFQQLGPKTAVLLVHHHRKSGGGEATASRGSGALPGIVDTIVELRRPPGTGRATPRRVLTGYGRHSETPEELTVELTARGFAVVEAREEEEGEDDLTRAEHRRRVLSALPPGWTAAEALAALPTELRLALPKFHAELEAGVRQGWWQRHGTGRRGSPFTYAGVRVALPSLFVE
jgi:hypothetical protein